jgi:hypothetical protein
MKYLSPLISDARKKLGSTIYARNRAGLTARAYVKPAQPRTPEQVSQRTNFASFATQWGTITQADRVSWNSLASTVLFTDTLGHRYHPTGYNLFIGCNRNLSYIGAAQLNTAPSTWVLPPAPPPATCTLHVAAGTVGLFTLTVTGLPDGFPADTVFKLTEPLAQTINFVRGSRFRRLLTAPTPFPGGVDLTDAYNTQFSAPVAMQRVFVALRTIDIASGFSSPVTRIMAVAE